MNGIIKSRWSEVNFFTVTIPTYFDEASDEYNSV